MFGEESPYPESSQRPPRHKIVSEGGHTMDNSTLQNPRIESATPSIPINKDTSAPRTRKTIGHYSIGKYQ